MWRLYGFYTPEVGDTHIWLLQFVNPIVKALQVEALRCNQCTLHTQPIWRLRFVLITLQVTLTFTCGMEFYYFNNHFTTIMQGCYNSARLRTPCTNCHNFVTTLSQLCKVAERLLQPSYFRMGLMFNRGKLWQVPFALLSLFMSWDIVKI